MSKARLPLNIAPYGKCVGIFGNRRRIGGMFDEGAKYYSGRFSRQHPLGQIGRNITLTVADVMQQKRFIATNSNGSSFKEAVIEITK
jgi:hypothetical protein